MDRSHIAAGMTGAQGTLRPFIQRTRKEFAGIHATQRGGMPTENSFSLDWVRLLRMGAT